MKYASGKDYDPSAWAKQRQERIKRALQARQKRQSGSPDKNHTFKPQLISSSNDGVSSKLPTGARVGDTSATQGKYDLSALENMEGAFPPKRTTSNIYRDSRFDNDSDASNRDKEPMDFGETRDSLDRLAVSTTDRRRLSRMGSTGNTGRDNFAAAPPPLPSAVGLSPHHDTGRNAENGYENRRSSADDQERESAMARRSRVQSDPDPAGRWTGPTREVPDACNGHYDGNSGEYDAEGELEGASATATGDALSYEMEQRPDVRGSTTDECQLRHPGWVGSSGGKGGGRSEMMGAAEKTRRGGWNDGGGGGGGGRGEQGGGGVSLEHRYQEQNVMPAAEEDVFVASLRGGEGREGAGTVRKGRDNAGRVSSGRQQPRPGRPVRRPEWNSDTASVNSLGDAQAAILTDNSPAAVQARVESSRRRKSDDVMDNSPYAPRGDGGGGRNADAPSRDINSGNTGWNHKHTKRLPWSEDGTIESATAAGTPEVDQDEDGFARPAVDHLGGGDGRERPGGGGRQGYRLQMIPHPSTGNLTMYRGDEETNPSAERRRVSADKEQLRRNLSLLKKKMHSQAGSRRSQSAGPRAGDLFGDPNAPGGGGCADSQHGGARQQLHKTTGTAPAMIPASPGAFLRDRETSGRGVGGRNGAGAGNGRPPPDGPGSPYAVDPNPRGGVAAAAARTSVRSHGHHESPSHRVNSHHQQRQQAAADKASRKDRFSSHGSGHSPRSSSTNVPAAKAQGGHERWPGGSHDPRRTGISARTAASAAAAATATATAAADHKSRQLLDRSGAEGGGRGIERTRRGAGGVARPAGLDRDPDGYHERGKPGGQTSPDRRRAWEGGHEGGGRTGGASRSKGGGGGGGGEAFGDELPPDAYPDREVELLECKMCARRFTPEALEKHSRVCQKVFLAKRKVFDAAQMRTKGTELEKFAKNQGRKGGGGLNGGKGSRGRGGGQAAPVRFEDITVGGSAGGKKTSKWRQQSTQFRNALRQARIVTDAQKNGKSLADLPPPEPSGPDPSLVPCPHCGRRFSELAGERHMRHCKDIKAKPSALKKGSGSHLGHAARKNSSGIRGGRSRRW